MAVAAVRAHTGYASKTSGTTATITTDAAGVTIDNTLYVWIVFDNLTATTPTVSSITKPANETSSWTLIGSIDSPQAAAAGGVRGELWGIRTQVAWPASTDYTITLSGTVAAKVVVVQEFSGATVTPRGTVAVGAATATTGGTAPSAGDVVIGCAATENNAAPAADTDTLDGSWAAGLSNASTGAGAATNAGALMQWKFPTAGGTQQTYNTTVTDGGVLVVALEAAPPPVEGVVAFDAGSSLTGGSLVTVPAASSLSASSTLTTAATTALPTNRYTVELWESGVFRATLATNVGVFTNNVLSVTWDSSILSDPTGAGVEIRITSQGLVDLGAVEWVGEFEAPVWQNIAGSAALVASTTLTAVGRATNLGTAALSATTTLTAVGTRVVPAAAALSASATLTAAAVRSSVGAAPLAASSTLTAAAVRTQFAAASLAASSTLTATSTVTAQGTTALSASATLTAAGTRAVPAVASLSASSTLAAAGTRVLIGAVSLSAEAVLTAKTEIQGFVNLSASSTLTAASLVTVRGTVALSASATLTAPALRQQFAAAVLTSSATMTVAGTRVLVGLVSMTASTTLTSVPSIVVRGAASLVAATTLTTSALVTVRAVASLVAAATLTPQARLTTTGIAAMTALASLVVNAVVWRRGTLRPDTILTQTNHAGALANIRDDPDLDDDTFWNATGSGIVRLGFEQPQGDLRLGAGRQEFRVLLRPGT